MAAKSLLSDDRYNQALFYMQKGAWSQALEFLQGLKNDFPDEGALDPLLQEAEFKAEFEEDWSGHTERRRFRIDTGRVLKWTVSIVVILAILYGAYSIYTTMVQPRHQANAALEKQQKLLASAEQALKHGDYQEALTAYEQVLAQEPNQEAAMAGAVQAKYMISVAETYDQAVSALSANSIAKAVGLFELVAQQAPGFRDVEKRLAQLKSSGDIETLFALGVAAYDQEAWEDAVGYLEKVRSINGQYESEEVTAKLFDAYIRSSEVALASESAGAEELETATERLRLALLLYQGEPEKTGGAQLLKTYLNGANALQAGNLQQALQKFLIIYAQDTSYLEGKNAQQIYNIYLSLGDMMRDIGEKLSAMDYYAKAANIDVPDTSEAQMRFEALSIGLPPTPTPTPTPTPAPTPIPEVTPAPLPPLKRFQGWIAFLSDRDGSEALYVMRPDGSKQRRVRDEDMDLYHEIWERQSWSPDGTTHVYAESSKDGKSVNIYVFRADLPENWERKWQYTDWAGYQYDPVWSPDNKYIAFVADTTGNDEIWIMGTDGSDKKQLTKNTWEWDKHPTWSPDSQQIAFFSNRDVGNTQIWIMNRDGSGQFNLSNNEFNDRNPVWIK